jgi:RNA polymerase-binding protein DksA
MAVPPKRTDIKIEEFRKLLLAERARLLTLHREQTADIRAEMADASENELSHTSTFDSAENEDTAAMMADRDRETALDENAKHVLHQIDHALDRISDGTYGICEVTGEPIPIERLKAIPWATMTVAAAAQYDR